MNVVRDITEVIEAVNALCDRKSSWNDGIHPELLEIITVSLGTIFKKGDRRVCGNYRGISLLFIPGKMFARILLNRLAQRAEKFLPEAHCGFRAGRGTSDIIFSLKQIQEKCIEQNMPLYMIFVDFSKAFQEWKLL